MYDESLRAPPADGDAAGDAISGDATAVSGAPGDPADPADSGEIVRGDPGELVQPTDDFDVLVLQFQKGERQEADDGEGGEGAAGSAGAGGGPAALGGRDLFDVSVVVE